MELGVFHECHRPRSESETDAFDEIFVHAEAAERYGFDAIWLAFTQEAPNGASDLRQPGEGCQEERTVSSIQGQPPAGGSSMRRPAPRITPLDEKDWPDEARPDRGASTTVCRKGTT